MRKHSNFTIKKCILGLIVCPILILIDQFTKHLAVSCLKEGGSIALLENVFELYYLENKGAAFGMLQNKQIIFLLITFAALILIAWVYLFRIPDEKRYYPLGLIALFLFSGAIGNLIDRVKNRYVVDFFYFKLIDFPVFNVADIYVTCGTIFLILLIVFYYKDSDLERIL
jgi:signal peptidase II